MHRYRGGYTGGYRYTEIYTHTEGIWNNVPAYSNSTWTRAQQSHRPHPWMMDMMGRPICKFTWKQSKPANIQLDMPTSKSKQACTQTHCFNSYHYPSNIQLMFKSEFHLFWSVFTLLLRGLPSGTELFLMYHGHQELAGSLTKFCTIR